MYYVCAVLEKNNEKYVGIIDTSDNVIEFYSTYDIKHMVKPYGLKILGIRRNKDTKNKWVIDNWTVETYVESYWDHGTVGNENHVGYYTLGIGHNHFRCDVKVLESKGYAYIMDTEDGFQAYTDSFGKRIGQRVDFDEGLCIHIARECHKFLYGK